LVLYSPPLHDALPIYPMIGDPTHEISSNFEILRPTGLADRGTFIVDPQGVIQAIEITAEGIGRDALELLRKVKAAQYVAAHPGEDRKSTRLNSSHVKI